MEFITELINQLSVENTGLTPARVAGVIDLFERLISLPAAKLINETIVVRADWVSITRAKPDCMSSKLQTTNRKTAISIGVLECEHRQYGWCSWTIHLDRIREIVTKIPV